MSFGSEIVPTAERGRGLFLWRGVRRSDIDSKSYLSDVLTSGQPFDVYSAFIQVSDPVSLTDTSEINMCRGLPSAKPRCSVANRIGPAFL